MRQLVGQACVHCRQRISSNLDARFCAACGCPVHEECRAATAASPGTCPTCGATAEAVAAHAPGAERDARERARFVPAPAGTGPGAAGGGPPRPPTPAERVGGPGRALVAVGVVNLSLGLLVALDGFSGLLRGAPDGQIGAAGVVVVAFALVAVLGGLDLLRLGSFDWAVAGCAAAVVPGFSPCCLGLPVGVWGLVTVFRADVRRGFGGPGDHATGSARPTSGG